MTKRHTKQDIIDQIEALTAMRGSKVALASEIGVHPSYISNILAGQAAPYGRVLKFLKMKSHTEKTVYYTDVEE